MLEFFSKKICHFPFPFPLQIWSPSHRRRNCEIAEADWVVKSHGPDSHRPHVGPQGVNNSYHMVDFTFYVICELSF